MRTDEKITLYTYKEQVKEDKLRKTERKKKVQ
jgi:hypothetical protein